MNHRYDFVLLFEARDANPNGDPDAGNLPRLDAESGHGLVTDVCLKRKIRNYVQLTRADSPTHRIYIQEKAILSQSRKVAYDGTGTTAESGTESPGVKDWMCRHFFDVRTFGAVMSTKEFNCGQVRGAVQLSFARSIDRVVTAEHSITRCAVETAKEAENQKGDNRTMGRKFTVPYALYRAHGFINPFLAAQTHFTDADLDVLKEAIAKLFDFDASAARPAGSMAARRCLAFKHATQLGNAPAHKLFEAVTIAKKPGIEVPRAYADYDVSLNTAALPAGITVEEWI